MPPGSRTTAKKTVSTPYPSTGEAARDSCRKRIFDVLSEYAGSLNEQVRGEWAGMLEDDLLKQAGKATTREYREQSRKLTDAIKKKGSSFFEEIIAQNGRPELGEILEMKAKPEEKKAKPVPGIKNPFPMAPVVRPPVVAPFVKKDLKERKQVKEVVKEKKTEEVKPIVKHIDENVEEKELEVHKKEIIEAPRKEVESKALDPVKVYQEDEDKPPVQEEKKSEATEQHVSKNQEPEEKSQPVKEEFTKKPQVVKEDLDSKSEPPKEDLDNKSEPPKEELIKKPLKEDLDNKSKPPKEKLIKKSQPLKKDVDNKPQPPKEELVKKSQPQKYTFGLGDAKKRMQESLARLLQEEQELISQPIPSDDPDSEMENGSSLSGSNLLLDTPASNLIINENTAKPAFVSMLATNTVAPTIKEIKGLGTELAGESSPMKTEDLDSISEIHHTGAKSVISTVTRYEDLDSLQNAYQKKREELEDCKHKLDASEAELAYCNISPYNSIVDNQKVKRLEEENDQHTKVYQESQRKLNEIQGKFMTDSSNAILLAGMKKDSKRVQKEIDTLRAELKKLNSAKQKEEDESKQIIADYKMKIEKLTKEKSQIEGTPTGRPKDKAAIDDAKAEVQKLKNELEARRDELAGLVSSKEGVLKESNEVEQIKGKMIGEIKDLQNEGEKWRNELKDYEEMYQRTMREWEEKYKEKMEAIKRRELPANEPEKLKVEESEKVEVKKVEELSFSEPEKKQVQEFLITEPEKPKVEEKKPKIEPKPKFDVMEWGFDSADLILDDEGTGQSTFAPITTPFQGPVKPKTEVKKEPVTKPKVETKPPAPKVSKPVIVPKNPFSKGKSQSKPAQNIRVVPNDLF